MDNVDAMLKAIEQEPDDLTAERALTDLLVEERDMNPTEAARHAEQVMQTARDARDLAEAARLMQPHQLWHAELCLDIRRHLYLPDGFRCVVVIVAGSEPPRLCPACPAPAPPLWHDSTITVGALWVIRHWRGNPSLCLPPVVQKRQPRRSR